MLLVYFCVVISAFEFLYIRMKSGVAVLDGKLYVVGGCLQTLEPCYRTEVFDPITRYQIKNFYALLPTVNPNYFIDLSFDGVPNLVNFGLNLNLSVFGTERRTE